MFVAAESDNDEGPKLCQPLYEGIYVSRSPINVDLMYISKRKRDDVDIARVRQRLLMDKDIRKVIDDSIEEIKNSETYFSCRTPDYFDDEALQRAMEENSVQFSILRNPDLTHTPGFSIFEGGHIMKTMNLLKQPDGSWRVFGSVSRSRAYDLHVQRHPLGSKTYFFVPICDGKCNWGSQKRKEEALEAIAAIPHLKEWMYALILNFAYGKHSFDRFIIEEYEKRSKRRGKSGVSSSKKR